jgi:hypothetical protein
MSSVVDRLLFALENDKRTQLTLPRNTSFLLLTHWLAQSYTELLLAYAYRSVNANECVVYIVCGDVHLGFLSS